MKNVLSELVSSALESGTIQELSKDNQRTFYQQFEVEISEKADEMRAEKRKAYEEAKNLILQ